MATLLKPEPPPVTVGTLSNNIMNPPATDFDIYTRPEIRKGCLWDIQLRFNPEFVKKHQLSHIHVEKPRGAIDSTVYLCLKIRSKLIKPVRELPFTKVAQTVTSEGDVLYFNDFSAVTLKDSNARKVKFTARPRAVFHKHSDMMILLVSVKKGERAIATSETELIFRGGTGSVHSAETRKLAPAGGLAVPPATTTGVAFSGTSFGFPLSAPPPATRSVPPSPQVVMQSQKQPELPTPSTPLSSLLSSLSMGYGLSPLNSPNPHPVLEFEDFDSHQFCADFIQNKGDSLVVGNHQHAFDDLLNPDNDYSGGLWAEHLFNEYEGLGTSSNTSSNLPSIASKSATSPVSAQQSVQVSNMSPIETQPASAVSALPEPECKNCEFTVVYGKRRGACSRCVADCTVYRGTGGPCSECGCFPAAHVNLDANGVTTRKRKRSTGDAGDNWSLINNFEDYEEETYASKRPRYLLEGKYFQKLFFSCLQFMSLQQISAVTARAPVPIWVKDSNLNYIYINSTFLSFIMDIAHTPQVLNHDISVLLDRNDADQVIKQEQYLMEQEEGTIKTFEVPVRREVFRVMKQWTKLPDGSKSVGGVRKQRLVPLRGLQNKNKIAGRRIRERSTERGEGATRNTHGLPAKV